MPLIMMIKSQRRKGIIEQEGAVLSAEEEEVTYRQQEKGEDVENTGEMTIEVEMVTICHPRIIAKTVTRLVPLHTGTKLQTKDEKMAEYNNLPDTEEFTALNKIKV